MRTTTRGIAAAAAFTLMSAGLAGTAATAATNTGGGPLPAGLTPINILNINDFHGRIDSNGTGALGKNFACTILTQRAALGAANTLTLGAGDLIGASPFTSAVQDDNPTLDFLDAVGLDGSSVGNHEFDKGWDDLTNRVQTRADFEYVGANVYLKGTTTPAMKGYESFDVAGVRVAVIGGVTADTPNLVAGEGIAAIDIGDPVAGVNRVANELTDGNEANGEADVLIAEYHEGGPYSSTTGTLADQLANPVFAHLVNDTSAKVAAVLQGHTHQAYMYDVQIPGAAAGQTRPVLQTGNYAVNLGKIQLGYNPSTRTVEAYNTSMVVVSAASPTCQADPAWQAAASIVDAAVAYAAPLANQQIGTVTADITRGLNPGTTPANSNENRGFESSLSNLIAQQYVESVNEPGRLGGAEIGIMNPGGVRADLLYGTDGKITFAQAANIMPFGNTLKTADYTGAQFTMVLEEQWQLSGSRPFLALGLSDNVTYTYDPTQARGSRITSVRVNGAPIDPAETYTVVSNSFLITQVGQAPDGFATLQRGTNYRDSGLVDQNAFMDWIRANSPVSPSNAKHGVALIPSPTPLTIETTATFSVESLDLGSYRSVQNSTVDVYVGSKMAGTFPVSSVFISSAPNRLGQATVSFYVKGSWLKDAIFASGAPRGARSAASTLRIVAPDSGTEVVFPIILKR